MRNASALSRRQLLRSAAAGALATVAPWPARAEQAARTGTPPSLGPRRVDGLAVYDLEISQVPLTVGHRTGHAIAFNGSVPGPVLRMTEGDDVLIRVTNRLPEDASVHWHGLLVPFDMDGVPGLSFPGIRPGETFEYRFRLRQYGSYWYHSHSAFHEQLGQYGSIVIEPRAGHPFAFDREHTIVLSDWTFLDPSTVLAKLKKQGNYFNYQRLTLAGLLGRRDPMPLRERLMWARMRMDPTDIVDVTGATYTYLMNGLGPEANWTGLFRPGERVLLRFVNAGANSWFDVRIPGLPMRVVEFDGQHVEEVETDEFRINIADTVDVIVTPPDDRAYTVFAESIDRSGHARGSLAPREGMAGPVPPRRPRPTLTMADMGMMHGQEASGQGGGMEGMAGMEHGGGHEGRGAVEIAVAGTVRTEGLRPPGTIPPMVAHEEDRHAPDNAMVPMMVGSRLEEPGIGLGEDGWRVLRYTDLRSREAEPRKAPVREIEMHLTGNMERFMWSIDGVPFEEAEPVRIRLGERVRLTMVNDTMMNHPMHLHGMWMELENGHGERIPRVHTINVKPAERVSLLITPDEPGPFAFHCHVLYHMEVGMFRVFEVSGAAEPPAAPATPAEPEPDAGGHEGSGGHGGH